MKRATLNFRRPLLGAWVVIAALTAWTTDQLLAEDPPPGSETPNPAAAGLWVGTVSLNKVNEVRGNLNKAAPSAGVFQFSILLHVDASGATKLIKDVVVMKNGPDAALDPDTGEVDGVEPTVVLVTDATKIGDFTGLMRRSGKLVGLRYGTAAYDFDGNELVLSGGIGAALACSGQIVLPREHPTNPFRHKYHPDHMTTNPLRPGEPDYRVTRNICLIFDGDSGDPIESGPGFGVDRITGIYKETITGLHMVALKTSGLVTLDRVSGVAVMNE